MRRIVMGDGAVELRLAGLAGSFAEQDVVVRVGIERRVEINEVNAGVGKFLRVAQPTQIVAKEKPVHVEAVYQSQLRRASKILSFPSPLFCARPPAGTSRETARARLAQKPQCGPVRAALNGGSRTARQAHTV